MLTSLGSPLAGELAAINAYIFAGPIGRQVAVKIVANNIGMQFVGLIAICAPAFVEAGIFFIYFVWESWRRAFRPQA